MTDNLHHCLVCGKPATKFCDAVLGAQIIATLPHKCASMDGPIWRCDAPLCDEHAAHQGNQFICGSKEIAGHDTIDYCPLHAAMKRAVGVEPMFEADAALLRRKAWAELRRQSIRLATEGHARDTFQCRHNDNSTTKGN